MKNGIGKDFKVSMVKSYYNLKILKLELTPLPDGLLKRCANLNIDYNGIKLDTGWVIYPEMWLDVDTLIPWVIHQWAYLF